MHISFGEAAAYHARTLEAVPHLYTPPVRQRLELARYVLAEDYVRAQEVREALRREVDAALRRTRCPGAADAADSGADDRAGVSG